MLLQAYWPQTVDTTGIQYPILATWVQCGIIFYSPVSPAAKSEKYCFCTILKCSPINIPKDEYQTPPGYKVITVCGYL